MKKTIIIIIIIIVAIVGAALFIVFKGKNTAPPTISNPTGELPPVSTSTLVMQHPTGTVLQLGTPSGIVNVNNFYNDPVQVSQDNTSVVIAQSSTYNITYYVPDSSFNIGIIKGPVSATLAQAEAAFLAALGISQADACKLNVMVGVPYDVDPSYADQNLGLSFCSSGAFQAP